MKNNFAFRSFLMMLAVVAIAGCGDGRPVMVNVSGRVVMNGAGVTAGSVYFHPDGTNSFQADTPSSQLQLDGSFIVKTFPFGDGVPPGKYKVTLGPEVASRVGHPEFGASEKTPWEVIVPESGLSDCLLEIK